MVLVQLAEAVFQVEVAGAGDELDLEDIVDRPHRDAGGLRLRLLLALQQMQERLLAGELQQASDQRPPEWYLPSARLCNSRRSASSKTKTENARCRIPFR